MAERQKKKPAAKATSAVIKKIRTADDERTVSVQRKPKKIQASQDAGTGSKEQSIVKKEPLTPIQPKESMMNMNMNNTKNFEKMSQNAANMSKEVMEACQESASILAKNSQNCMSSYMTMMQSMAEKQAKIMKEMLSKKTINEMSETLQSASQESFNDMMMNMSKMSEQTMKAAMDCMEPISCQMTKAMKKASDSVAA
ncbi:MAG: phasin family protein [Rhodospirillales bacterium]|nr:phasin family protein [Rhodospirillales bacterium]MCB9973261.1 phasin family protein [Rhodospirillales bacterium]